MDVSGSIIALTTASDPADTRYDYTSGNLDYIGMHSLHKAAASATTWKVYKFTWSGNNIIRKEKLKGSWEGRADLDWA